MGFWNLRGQGSQVRRRARRFRALDIRVGPKAYEHLRERGLRPDDVSVMPGASGGPKWLVLSRLDRAVMGHLLGTPRTRPLHLIGSSIGSWRLALFAQKNPVEAVTRFEEVYRAQTYGSTSPAPSHVSYVNAALITELLGANGAREILQNENVRLHIVTTHCRGLSASERKPVLMGAMTMAAFGNAVSRKNLGWQMRRAIFHSAGDASPFRSWNDLPTDHHALDETNLPKALLASASVPMLLNGVRIDGAAADGIYRDGGVVDYHFDVPFNEEQGLVLYPHFYSKLTPGWFDKALPWRRAGVKNFSRAVMLSPSESFVASLPEGRIPDRNDFVRHTDAERAVVWKKIVEASERLADEYREWCALPAASMVEHVSVLGAPNTFAPAWAGEPSGVGAALS